MMRRNRTNLSNTQRLEVVRRFRAGQKAKDLAELYGMTTSGVYLILRKARNGVPLRPEREKVHRPVPARLKQHKSFSAAEARHIVFLMERMELPASEIAADQGITEDDVRAVMARYYGDHDVYGPITEADGQEVAPTRTTKVHDFECKTEGCIYQGRTFTTNLHPDQAFCPHCRVRVVGLQHIASRDIVRTLSTTGAHY